jgi:hypothetical protein
MRKPGCKASDIIKGSCCGTLLDVPVSKLAIKVKKLEDENEILKGQNDFFT